MLPELPEQEVVKAGHGVVCVLEGTFLSSVHGKHAEPLGAIVLGRERLA